MNSCGDESLTYIEKHSSVEWFARRLFHQHYTIVTILPQSSIQQTFIFDICAFGAWPTPPHTYFLPWTQKTAKLHEQPYIYILKKGRGQSSIQYVFNLPGPEERRGDRVGGQRHDEAGSFLRRIHKPWCLIKDPPTSLQISLKIRDQITKPNCTSYKSSCCPLWAKPK